MRKPCPKCGTLGIPGRKCETCGAVFPPPVVKPKPIPKKLPNNSAKEPNKNLFTCKDCGAIISRSAKACPVCGNQIKKKSGCAIFIILMVIGLMWISYQDHATDKKNRVPKKTIVTEAEKEQKKIEREKKRAEEYELCKKSLQCWGEKHSLRATYASKKLIEKHATYDFEWTDGWLGSKISKMQWKDKNKLTLIYFGDKIKFQNKFGAWQNMIYRIEYDPINEKLISLKVDSGRL